MPVVELDGVQDMKVGEKFIVIIEFVRCWI